MNRLLLPTFFPAVRAIFGTLILYTPCVVLHQKMGYVMSSTLFYGVHEFQLRADEDIPALLVKIRKAVNSGMAKWIDVRTDTGTQSLLITGHLTVRVFTPEPAQPVFYK